MATKKRSRKRPARKKSGRRYGKGAQKKVAKVMREYKKGTLKSGKGRHPKVKSKKQAIAIGLSEARKAGKKVPKRRSKKSSRRSRR